MIGNDIVDLELAKIQSNWRRNGFLDKTFSNYEKRLILTSNEPDMVVWRLWSMKESVYKASLRVKNQILLNPIKFECHFICSAIGKVYFDGNKFDTSTQFDNDYVHTKAFAEGCENGLSNNIISSNNLNVSSKNLYQDLKLKLAVRHGWDSNEISFKKNELGVPEVYYRGEKSDIRISLSHHGRFGAYLALC